MQRMLLENDCVGALIYILHDLLSTDSAAQLEMSATFNELFCSSPQNVEKYLGLPRTFKF